MSDLPFSVRPFENRLEIAVVEREGGPGVWTVEAIDMANDGAIYQAIFCGPDAEQRAREYRDFKYGSPPQTKD